MQGGDTMALLNSLWPFVLMGGIFYFMLWRPQKKEQQKRQDLLNSLKEGDEIITIGGIYGKIKAISEKRVKVEVAEGVVIEMARNAVSGFQNPAKNS
ncbi:preprotein translocase subunit YajC [Phascolarctobacterium sp.]